jgi:uncharacterized alkaline shock family protein YloU
MEENTTDNVNAVETVVGENDTIKISDDVVAVIAGVAVSEVKGVAGMAGNGISEVFKSKKNMSKGIKTEINDNIVKLDVNIIVEFGVRIPDVAFEIQNKVKQSVEAMTGLKVDTVNVNIQGVSQITNKNDEADTVEISEEEADI